MTEEELDAMLAVHNDGGRIRTHSDMCYHWHGHAYCAVHMLVAEVKRLKAELAAIKARVHDAYLRGADESNPHEPTGDQLLDRLRGIYTVPVNDGAGALNGSMTFTRKFPTLPINLEAAAEIERLLEVIKGLVAVNVGLQCDDILAHTGDDV